MRRFAFPLRLAAVRLAKRPERVFLVGAGIAAAAAMLAAVLAGSLVVRDRSLARTLERVPEADRSVFVAHFGIPPVGGDFAGDLDPPVRQAVRLLSREEPIRIMRFKEVRIGGELVTLAAADGLRAWARLSSGRLPRPCTRMRCEVVQLGGRETDEVPAARIQTVLGVRVDVVGRGSLTSSVPFGELGPQASFAVGTQGYTARPRMTPPFLVAEGVAGLSSLPALESIYRSYGWVVPLDAETIHPWGIDDLLARVTDVRSVLESESTHFDVAAPDDELRAAEEAGAVAASRLLLIGGQAAALLLAFAVLAASTMRRDVDASWRRLTWFGARRWQLLLLLAAEATAVVAVATLLGWAVGGLASAIVAQAAGSPPFAVVRHSVLDVTGLALAAALATAAALVLVVSLRARPVRVGGLSVSVVDAAALGALAAVALALVRGDADAGALAEDGGTGTFLLLLPGLVVFIAAVVVARALGPSLRLLQRLARGAGLPLRLASLSLARNPGRAAIAAAFLVVSVGLALFAHVYRSTLLRSEVDQAGFAVPLDFVVREKLAPGGLVSPLEAAPLSRYEELADGVDVVPVVRLRGSAIPLAGARDVTVLGIPAEALAALRGWREDFSRRPLGDLGAVIEPPRAMELNGTRLPDDAAALLLPIAVQGERFALKGAVETPRGGFVQVNFGETSGRPREVLEAPVPPDARGGRLVALTFGLTATDSESARLASGTATLGRLAVVSAGRRTELPVHYRDWIGVNGIQPQAVEGDATLRYFVSHPQEARFRMRQPTDGRPVPVIATPRLGAAAGTGGALPVRVLGAELSARVAETARHFPSLDGDFVVADLGWVATALNADSPGAAVPRELWLRAPSAAIAGEIERALARPPFDVLEVRSRTDVEAELRSDPIARGSLATLAAAAAVALALALAGLLLSLVVDVRDERREFFVLEAQGAAPAALRRHLGLRTLVLVAFGLAGGLATAVALSTLVIDLVAVAAGATEPQPPLVLDLDPAFVAAGLAGYAVITALVVGAVTRAAFRAPTPARAVETDG